MKKTYQITIGAVALATGILSIADRAQAAAFTAGDVVVEQVGTTGSSTALSSAAASVYLDEFGANGGALVQTIQLGTANVPLTTSGTATSEGLLSRSSDGRSIVVPGYNAAAGTTGVASGTSVREIGVVAGDGSQVDPVQLGTAFSGNNIRGAGSDGTTLYASGANTGIVSPSGTAPGYTVVSSTSTNNRAVVALNIAGTTSVYFSTGSGTRGIYQITTGSSTANSFIATGAASSPYGFSISPDGLTAYVADDRSVGTNTGGVEKFTRSSTSGTFTLAYTFSGVTGSATAGNSGTRGLAVNYANYNSATGNGAVLYATTTETSANRLITFTDAGTASAATLLETAGANTVFRGVDFAPTAVPEPATWAAGGLSVLMLAWAVARRGFRLFGV